MYRGWDRVRDGGPGVSRGLHDRHLGDLSEVSPNGPNKFTLLLSLRRDFLFCGACPFDYRNPNNTDNASILQDVRILDCFLFIFIG